MIELDERPEGIVFSVRAHPGARKSEVRGIHNGALKVAVTQVAEKGKANQALLTVLADALGLRRSQIELVSGETASQKRVCVRGIGVADLRTAIERLLSGG